jgi:Sulfotransferase family/Tetratricopeptide repeat
VVGNDPADRNAGQRDAVNEIVELLLANARALNRQGQLHEAMAVYADILRDWPGGAESNGSHVVFELATLQRKAGMADAALDSYSRAIAGGLSNPEEAYLHRGLIFSDLLRDHASAERELRAALRLNERYVPALHNLGNLYEDLGRLEEARAAYAHILALDSNWFEALGRFAMLLPRSVPEHDWVRRLRSGLVNPRAGAADRAGLGFALGQLLDSRQRYAEAFDAYCAANAASRASVPPQVGIYDQQRQEDLISSLIRAPFVPLASESPRAQDKRPQPVFICGMFRSGSTLTEQLLTSRPDVGGGGELPFFPRLAATAFAPFPDSLPHIPTTRLESAREAYLAMLAPLFPGKTWVIDKRPDNYLYLGLIKTLFPRAKIIHTVRAPLDNCLSIFFLHLDPSMSYALDLMDIGHYYRQYRRLMDHWQMQFGADIIDFDYDEFVRAPAQAGARLFESLGLEWDDRYLARPAVGRVVRTASAWQVRQPIYTQASGRASNYSAQLEQLTAYLADLTAATTLRGGDSGLAKTTR